MSHLRYSSYPGWGQRALERANMSQAVRIPAGETVQISGQGGWDRATDVIPENLGEEINQAFENVHETLIHEGGPGINSVFKLTVYYAPYSDEALEYTLENMKKWFPNHPPLITAIGVEKLSIPGMRIEVEAWAHLGSSDESKNRLMASWPRGVPSGDTVKTG